MDFVNFDAEREELIDYLIRAGFLKTERIISAFRDVHRHIFVPPEHKAFAYGDMPLQIRNAATISQPSTVAVMLEHLQPRNGEKVLEIGTGSGWEACLLSRCVSGTGTVVTIEIDPQVAKSAEANMSRLGYGNIRSVVGDGSIGYEKDGPYDRILYAAAAPEIPAQVIAQLRLHGRVVAPVGKREIQALQVVDKVSENRTEEHMYGAYRFAPLRGQLGF